MADPTCLIIAGEKSGEEHCLSFLEDLRKILPRVGFFGVGGDLMQAQGVELLFHLNDFSSWGITEVIPKIPFYFRAMRRVVEEVEKRQCKVALLIDFQTFNLKLARKLKEKGVNVLYYVAPQAWAWKPWRAEILGRTVHTLFTILPFEKQWFSERGVPRVKAVIHPLYHHYHQELGLLDKEKKEAFFERPGEKSLRILLLPGSRHFEVSHLLPEFLQTVRELSFPGTIETRLVRASSVKPELYRQHGWTGSMMEDKELVKALKWADLCLAASGTVTLACALFSVPTVVCYKASLFNAFVYYSFISYRGPISLANIFHQERVFPELIQDEVSSYNIRVHLEKFIGNRDQYQKLRTLLHSTKEKLLGDPFSFPHYVAQVLEESYGKLG